jgi:hypothetical protein
MDNFKEIAEAFLPDGILEYFYFLKIERKVEDKKEIITIHLEEKEDLPEISEEHKGKRIRSKGFSDITIEDFPMRGKKLRLRLKRRWWKIEGVKKLIKKDIPITYPNTKLEKEFGFFFER